MPAITNPPVQSGDQYVIRYDALATATPTDHTFPSTQDTVTIFNLGSRNILANGIIIEPNDSDKVRNVQTIQIKALSPSQIISFRLEGRVKVGSVGDAGTDAVARNMAASLDANKLNISDFNQALGSKSGLPTWLNDNIYSLMDKLDKSVRQIGVNIKQPPFNAKGDGVTDDTAAVQDAIDYAFNNGRLSVFFPNGEYLLTSTIIVPPLVDLTGQSKEGTIFYIEHTKWGFEMAINKLVTRPLQGGSARYSKFTVRRKVAPSSAIPENYGFYTKGTFGVTVFSDIIVSYMGSHACYQFDPSTAGTGPIYYNNCWFLSNFFGYGYYAQGTFVNIYLLGTNSWGNGGGFYFDGTKTSEGGVNASSYLPNNIVIQQSDSEYAGGFHATGTAPPSGKAYTKPVIYAKRISNLVIKDSVLHNSINFPAGHADYITGVPTCELASCQSVSIENTQFQNKLGQGNNVLVISGTTDYVNINPGTMLFGYKPGTTENPDYLLRIESTAKNIMLFNPKIADGNVGKDVYLNATVNPIFIMKNAGQIGYLRTLHDNEYWKINLNPSGTTATRPTIGLSAGFMYYDTTLGKPIWWNGSAWKDVAGTTV